MCRLIIAAHCTGKDEYFYEKEVATGGDYAAFSVTAAPDTGNVA